MKHIGWISKVLVLLLLVSFLLTLPGGAVANAAVAPLPSVTTGYAPESPQGGPCYRIHVVRRGETLSGIARANGVTVQDLLNLNRIRNRNIIYVGECLRVPCYPTYPGCWWRPGNGGYCR